MSKLRRVEGGYLFYCPGCKETHLVGDSWQFNGSLDEPTFSPSILVRGGHNIPGWKEGDSCWCTYNKNKIEKGEEPSGFNCVHCHSHIVNGQIQFLSDCHHDLKNQTVVLPEFNFNV